MPNLPETDQDQWSFLTDTYWYVPTPYLPAVLLLGGTATGYLVDQTLWHITNVVNGYVFADVTTTFGSGYTTSTLVGSITPSGQVLFSFTPEDNSQPITLGSGTMVNVGGDWLFEMQMTTGSGSGSVSHWAYMAEALPGDRAFASLPGYPGSSIPQAFDGNPANDAGASQPLALQMGSGAAQTLTAAATGGLLFGLGGDDVLQGSDRVDGLVGGAGDDQVFGGGGADDLYGQSGDDTLNGGAGNDLMQGEAGRDLLQGGGGEDVLNGGSGRNILVGGAGADSFAFDSAALGAITTIRDFTTGQDKIDLRDLSATPLHFSAQTSFDGTAGHVILVPGPNGPKLQVDLAGDGLADLTVSFGGPTVLMPADLLL